MDEADEQPKVQFIDDITQEVEHNVGNFLVTARTALELSESGHVFSEQEDAHFLQELRKTKDDLVARLDRILSSEFDSTGNLSKESIASFRETVDTDWADPANIRSILDAFERLKAPLHEEVEAAQEQLRQSP